jgi:hypothetical protein
MKSFRPLLAFALTLASLAQAQTQPSALEKTRHARAQIDALLGPRRNPPPAPADLANPFAAARTTVEPGPDTTASVATVSSDQEILARTLKIGGTAELAGRPQLIVNGLAYKEGDLIAVRDGDQMMRVRLVRIAPPSAVFELNGNEVILRIRN